MFDKDRKQEAVVQRKTTARLITTARDMEALVIEIPMGEFMMIVIANIPEEGSTEAPAYIKFKLNEHPRTDTRGPKQVREYKKEDNISDTPPSP